MERKLELWEKDCALQFVCISLARLLLLLPLPGVSLLSPPIRTETKMLLKTAGGGCVEEKKMPQDVPMDEGELKADIPLEPRLQYQG